MKLKYSCRGPVVGLYTDEDVKKDLVGAASLGHKKRGLVKQTTLKKGRVEVDESGETSVVKPEPEDVLSPCGFDLSTLIDGLPEDGLVYEVVCPRCGNVADVRRGFPADEG